ncbi:ribosomal RNA small subunit methyltransferase A [Candidatus Parcubacteria bacterium]|nr:ribosomal RNA small subunit methyltransferase A [Candidatus Parcubacteria bacterium]
MATPHTSADTKSILAHLGIKPERRLGQNFLVDQSVRDRIIQLAAIQPHDLVLEVGPGLGALTEALARHATRVVAVEKDRTLANYLTEAFAQTHNVEIVWADIRRIDIEKALGMSRRTALQGGAPRSWIVVANPPYYLAPFLIRTLLGEPNPPRQITLVVQHEIADRITSGTGEMNLLALAAQLVSRVTKHDRISRRAFWPQPAVDSTIITLVPLAAASRLIKPNDEAAFFFLMRPLFRGKRKQILGSLARSLKKSPESIHALLEQIGINPKARPEDISVDKWARLFRILEAHRI